MQKKICCFTGSRPQNLPWKQKSKGHRDFVFRLEDEIMRLIQAGFNHFISGMALGVDMDVAETLFYIRERKPKIKFTIEAAVPCRGQAAKWSDVDRDLYEFYLKRVDELTVIQESYTPECYQRRNEYMVDKSSLVIGSSTIPEGGTANTLIYALKRGKKVKIVYPTDSKEGAACFLDILQKIAKNPDYLKENREEVFSLIEKGWIY